MKLLSKIISALFHPMLMPSIGVLLLFQAGTHLLLLSFEAKRIIFITVFLSSALLPLSLLPLLFQFGVIKSFNMVTARERVFPLIFTTFFYFLGYSLLKRMGVPSFIGNFILMSLVALLIATVITMFWKISMHMIGIGGVVAALLSISIRTGGELLFFFLLFVIFAGLTASSRLYLSAHKPSQIYCGFLLGFMTVFLSLFL